MKKFFVLSTVGVAMAIAVGCGKGEEQSATSKPTTLNINLATITPAPFPELQIPGFTFPEDADTIISWVQDTTEQGKTNVYKHGWGIWAGLTAMSNQVSSIGDTLRVYETWQTPKEIIASTNITEVKRDNRTNLKTPKQLGHAGSVDFKPIQLKSFTINTSVKESVAYDPTAAKRAKDSSLFMATKLYEIYERKGDSVIKNIPAFPNTSILIKPVYKLLKTASDSLELFPIATWHGTTETFKAFNETDWGTYVIVSTKGKGAGNGSQLHYLDKGFDSDNIPAKYIYNLSDFIHYTLSAEDASAYNEGLDDNEEKASEGDTVILVAMHVTTREIERWTWQTYWWAPDATNAPLPSSKAIANQQPEMLDAAASHYAMSVAYYMVNPLEGKYKTPKNQAPNYSFNPYLEAGFSYGVFAGYFSDIDTPTEQIPTYVGVRTNCMSCHAMASIDPLTLQFDPQSITPYVGASYTGLNDAIFKNQLKLDFAWSIEGNIDTTGISAYLKKLKRK
ncbi:hypothetical protein NBRC110019_16180 [Neptunitalea chrysea]|uniref:Lipoprotein n=1 Tax=Neptunitalea chrysea TaxID=1647581 RepID=A0A9W6B4N5_9FLAO|nr:hypothetical protein [Neptunitalea chrysea]GLB52578.1 hypothetical protein NBRC110019_16180 [Neptunitalea chrysea]